MTYAARSCDESRASAPSISGRFKPHGEASFASHIASRLWVMLSFQIMAYFAKVKELSPEAELVRIHGAKSGDNGRLIRFTLNRRFRRKFAHRQRRGRISAPRIGVHDPADSEDNELTPKQYFEKQIRIHKWNRAVVFKLGLTAQERQDYALRFIGLQGCAARLRQAMMCNTPLSPD